MFIGLVLLISGAYTYYRFFVEELEIDLGFFKFIPFMLIIFGFIAIILGLINIQKHETIKVDGYGITITKGNKSKKAPWNEINRITSTMTFVFFYSFVHYVPMIVIESLNWKHKIKRGNFSLNDLTHLFLNIGEWAKTKSVTVVDGLEWLPKQMEFQKSRIAGISVRMREYRILFRIGLSMLILGLLLFIPFFALDIFDSNLFIICILLLFFGIMLTIAGVLGIYEEKKKIEE
jgi:hypothetical protein